MKPRAIIFDFDGVLVDTEPLHMGVWQEILVAQGLLFSKGDYYDRYIGLNDRDFLDKVFKEHQKSLRVEQVRALIQKKEIISLKKLSQKIPLIPGIEKFLKKSNEAKIRMSIVTGALPAEVDFILTQMNWKKYFPIVITSADVQKGKPDPEGFLMAFRQLQSLGSWKLPLQKSDCLIFEDSQNGLKAAQNAGIAAQRIQGSWETLNIEIIRTS